MIHSSTKRAAGQGSRAQGSDGLLGAGALVFLILAVLLAFVPGQWTVPPIDRDEPRYTQATKQMLETGNFVEIRFHEAPRHKKPVGIHWLQAGAATATGHGEAAPLWVYRLPSLAGAIAAVLLAAWVARAFLPLPLALTVGALFGATIILGVEARLAKTDAVLVASTLVAQGALARIWLAGEKGWAMPLLMWVAIGVGVLVKGPIAPMVVGLTVAVLAVADGRAIIGRIRPLTGLLVAAAVALPWYAAIWIATDGDFFRAAVGTDLLGKTTEGQEGHGAPPLTHLAFFLVVGWPLAAFTLAALWGIWRRRGPVFLFALAWVVPTWIVFEAVTTKLPHYTLPALAGVALAVVAALAVAEPPRWARVVAGLMIPLFPVAMVIAIPVGFGLFGTLTPWAAVVLCAVAGLLGCIAAAEIFRGAPMLSGGIVGGAVGAAVLAQAAVWGLALPALEPVWVSSRLVAAVEEAAPCPDPRLLSVGGYNEPSMIFLAGTETGLLAAPEAVAILGGDCAVLAASGGAAEEVEAAASEAGLAVERAGVVEGFNISKGDPVRLTLFRRAD